MIDHNESGQHGSVATALDEFRAAIRSLDLSQETRAIAAKEAMIAEMEGAATEAGARSSEISNVLLSGDYLDDGHSRGSGSAVADALLAGSSVRQASATLPDRGELERERRALNLGAAEIRKRIEPLRRDVKEVQGRAAHKVHDAARPLIHALTQEAVAAGHTFAACAAALAAINYATGVYVPELSALKAVISKGAGVGGREIGWNEDVAVPDEVREALAILQDLEPTIERPQLIRKTRFH